VNGSVLGDGEGRTKKQAEQLAASDAIRRLEVGAPNETDA